MAASSSFALSPLSQSRLEEVHPDLRRVVRQAIHLSVVDFAVLEGRRSRERQEELFRSGASHTLNSRHLTGHAVDLGVWRGGEISWHWPEYLHLAAAVREASLAVRVPVVWGGCWCTLSSVPDVRGAVREYVDRRESSGFQPFLDGGHFELPRDRYP